MHLTKFSKLQISAISDYNFLLICCDVVRLYPFCNTLIHHVEQSPKCFWFHENKFSLALPTPWPHCSDITDHIQQMSKCLKKILTKQGNCYVETLNMGCMSGQHCLCCPPQRIVNWADALWYIWWMALWAYSRRALFNLRLKWSKFVELQHQQ